MATVCPACGHDNREGRRFCAECGTVLDRPACPSCGASNESGEKFCGDCGVRLTQAAAPSPPAIAASPERKHITVLFADVAGSMDLQEQLDSEVWAQIMGRFVSVLAEGIGRFGGTVDKFTGDGIMALFGAPVAQEDHARRACHAARHLTVSIGAYSEELRREQGVDLHVRLGLNSGEVVVGRVGENVTLDPTALGHTVGLAQRMESLAEPGQVYLTEATARLVQGWFRLEHLGSFPIKGARDPQDVYALGAPAASPGRPRVGASPLVGRQRELAVLEDALAMAMDGHAQVVGVVGEAGVGKSRLCDEFAQLCRARGITVRRAAGVSHGRDVPLLPILAFHRDYFGISDADDPPTARRKVSDRLLELDPGLDDALPLMFDLLEVPDPDRPVPRMAPEVRMRRIFDVVRRITARRSEREILVLLFEDLHWFDSHSEGFLERLIESYPGSRTLVVTNFRPEFSAGWTRHSYYRQLPLSPLREQAVSELLGGLLGVDLSLEPLVSFLLEHTGGNPFYVEEVVRTLIEDGTLAGGPGKYRMTRPLQEIRVPPSVHAVVAARIDRLPPDHKNVMQTAAVIGRTFDSAVLARVTGSAADGLDQALSGLCAAELLQETAHDPTAEYRFWHPLTQEVAYGSLLTERRRALHAAVGRATIEADPERLDQKAALIASHFERAGDLSSAAQWNFRAGGWAVRSDFHEAIRRWRMATEQLDGVPATEDTRALGTWARARLLQIGSRTGMSLEEAERLVTEGRTLSEGLPDAEPLMAVTRFHTSVQLTHGQVRGALDGLIAIARQGDASGDPGLAAALWSGPAICYSWVGPVRDGLQAVEHVEALCGDDPNRGVEHQGYSPITLSSTSYARLLAQAGRLRDAAIQLDAVVARARVRAEPEWVALALATYAPLADWTGEGNDVLARAGEALRITEDLGNAMFRIPALHGIGVAQLLDGQIEEALGTLEAALEETRTLNAGRFEEAAILAHQARARLAIGDAGAALHDAREAVTVSRHQGARLVECQALLTNAHVLRVTGDGDHAAAVLKAATTLVNETGASTYEPFITEEVARLHPDETVLRQALDLYRQIGATGHARRLESELSAGAQGSASPTGKPVRFRS
jgi:class 3 adenylate cyclase/tetratricopeptide (TPR) repeat protein